MVWNKSTVGTGTDVANRSDAAWAIGSKGTPYSKSGIYSTPHFHQGLPLRFALRENAQTSSCPLGPSPLVDMRGYVLVPGQRRFGGWPQVNAQS